MRVLTDMQWLRPVGGVEVCTLEDTTALAGRGHDVRVFFGEDGALRAAFERAGAGLEGPVPFKLRSGSPARDLRSFLPAVRLARRLRPDVVWLNRAEHIAWGTLIARAGGAGLVCSLHHAPSSARVRLLARGVGRFAAVSAFTRDQWIEAGVRPDRVEVLHNALPPGRYPAGGAGELHAARAALGLPVQGRVVTFYGRFGEEKGLPTLLDAFRRLGRDDTTLLLAGFYPPDQDTAAVRAEVESQGPARVRVVPGSADVVPFLHAADVVVSPSWVQEAFGRTVVEGMSTGRPVVASRVGGTPELLEGGMERLLVPSRDPGALAAALSALLDWREREPSLGDACRAWVAQRFPWERRLDRLEALLREQARR